MGLRGKFVSPENYTSVLEATRPPDGPDVARVTSWLILSQLSPILTVHAGVNMIYLWLVCPARHFDPPLAETYRGQRLLTSDSLSPPAEIAKPPNLLSIYIFSSYLEK